MFKPDKFPMTAGTEYTWELDENVKFKSSEDGEAYICKCGKTEVPPYCDGAHIALNRAMDDGGE
jgi:CDGSH-type Zn-finger protein